MDSISFYNIIYISVGITIVIVCIYIHCKKIEESEIDDESDLDYPNLYASILN